MSARSLTALRSFWEYASFIINSLVFLLIGLEVRLGGVLRAWKPILMDRRSDLPRSHSVGLHACANQQPIFQANPFRVATRAGLGWIARSVVAGPGVESR